MHGPPDAARILARQGAHESTARTYGRNLPIVPVRAQGTIIEGADGRTYLDCLAGAGSLALGHNHPATLEAIQGVLQRGAPLQVLDIATPERDELVEALLATLPPELANGRIHFCGPAGTDAVEAALKVTQWATGRRGVAAFTGGYHGMTAAALATTGNVAARELGMPAGFEVTRLPFPYPYRCPFGLGGRRTAEVAASYAQRLLDDPNGGVAPLAAMVVEAVQGEGGVVPAPDGWLQAMRRTTAERGIPLVLDEVQAGVGRTGRMWAFEHAGIVPDVVVVSKAIGGGLPLAAIVYRAELDGWPAGAHTGTFRGNQLAMAAGAATLRVVRAEGLVERAAELGTRLVAGLRQMAERHPAIGEVRGRGLMLGIELVHADGEVDACGARPANPTLAAQVRRACLERGLIVELGGRDDTVVRLLPPLTISDAEAASVLERLDDAFGSLAGARRTAAARRSVAFTPASGPDGAAHLAPLVEVALDALEAGARERGGPIAPRTPAEVAAAVRAALGEPLPDEGVGAAVALGGLARVLSAGSADAADPASAAHLLCPPLAVAAVADLVVAALNPSLDSWDQAPAATTLEGEVVGALATLIGWDPAVAGGSTTTGGTESNLVGLLLGRERAAAAQGVDGLADGVAPGMVRVFASEVAHFSVQRACGVLGLGERAVTVVPVDAGRRMRSDALAEALARHGGPAVVVATAGTTDFGSIDPLPAVAAIARAHGAWLHVDAAYGGLVKASPRLAPLLDGIEQADSIALDLHKLGWLPAAAGALLVRDASLLAPLDRRVAYLNPADDEAAGYVSLLGRSLRTTRRSDAFKVAVTLRALGRRGLGELVERCHDLALHAAERVGASDRLVLEAPPVLTTVVFRYAAAPDDVADDVNAALRRRLLREGRAVVGRTSVPSEGGPSTRLKLTFLNPATATADVDRVLELVVAAGDAEAAARR